MPVHRLAPALLACGLLLSQQPAPSPAPAQAPQQPPQAPTGAPTFRGGVTEVVVPVTVLDRDGNYVNGLQPNQFRLFDNEKEQDIHVDVSYQPISLVIAVQANDHVEAILPQIRKIGPLLRPLVVGDAGEIALLKFDHRVIELQPFTTDVNKIEDALKKIQPGSTSNAITDAVMQGTRMLSSRPKNRRRILLLISETRENGRVGRVKDSLLAAELANVNIYAVDISRFVSTLTAKPQPGRPDPLPPAMHPLPPGVPATPTSVQQTYGTGGGGRAEFVPLLVEIFRDVKAVFIDNPVEVYTKGTGGTEFGFTRQRGLEDAISKVGTELHSQYLITYSPTNKEEGGWHDIAVDVPGHRDIRVRTRPGYWVASQQ